ncbi:MAG: hypothetical protein ACRCX2_32375 [Paraclostridium sp.]
MLNTLAKDYASQIATQLVQEGMLWGDELEWFIRLALKGLLTLDAETYDAIEAEILEIVESRRRRIKIKNIKDGEVLYFTTTKEINEKLGLNMNLIYDTIRNGSLCKKTYLIQYERPSIKDM